MKRFIVFLLTIKLSPVLFATVDSGCSYNSKVLCKRRYNEVAYPATHNGHSYKESDVHTQDLSLKKQFALGIRATTLQIWYHPDTNGKAVPFVCYGIDKALLYNPPIDKALDQVPFLFRPFARTLIQKADPLKEIIVDAFCHAYGTDNAKGALPFKHCIFDPARQPLKDALGQVHDFLLHHPHDIITLILQDHTRNLDGLSSIFKKADLMRYVHVQDIDKPWPTVQDMIKADKRLVIFLDADENLAYKKYPWMHYLWDYAWDTKHDFKDVCALKDACYDVIPYRGKKAFERRNKEPRNTIFLVHHFVSDAMGGSKQHAVKANRKTVLRSRLKRLEHSAHHIPTIIEVDFFEYPPHDFLNVINELNGINTIKN